MLLKREAFERGVAAHPETRDKGAHSSYGLIFKDRPNCQK